MNIGIEEINQVEEKQKELHEFYSVKLLPLCQDLEDESASVSNALPLEFQKVIKFELLEDIVMVTLVAKGQIDDIEVEIPIPMMYFDNPKKFIEELHESADNWN